MKKLGFYCVIDTFSKDKKGITIVNAFQKILDNSAKWHSMTKPNRIWVDKGSEFYNRSFKKWLKDNDIKMHSTQNEEKWVVVERFIRTLKNNT